MKSYVQPHMLQSLSQHVLSPAGDVDHWMLHRPGTSTYHCYVLRAASRIILTGDLIIRDNGVISQPGYGLDWFASDLGESYLCEKFLRKSWQPECALQWTRSMIEECEDEQNRIALQEICRGLKDGLYCERAFVEDLGAIHPSYADDGAPGYDYPLGEAGWLCAVQQTFRGLYPP